MSESQTHFSYELHKPGAARLVVMSDTHVPDRVGALHPEIVPLCKKFEADLILHAGDISTPRVLEQFKSIAPVISVQGNRDIWSFTSAKKIAYLKINSVNIAILHGHFSLLRYFIDKIPYYLFGYKFERYPKKLKRNAPEARVIIFGHTHHRENRWINDCLFFNPGSAYEGDHVNNSPSIGLIEIGGEGQIKGTIVPLSPAKWVRDKWVLLNHDKM